MSRPCIIVAGAEFAQVYGAKIILYSQAGK